MAETPDTPALKIQYEYQNPNNVESEVPGSQNIREVTEKSHVENRDGAEIQNGGYAITRSFTEQSEIVEGTKITTTTVTLSTSSTSEELIKDEEIKVVSEKTQIEDARPKTKIPKLKFRQAAERVKRDRRLTRGITQHETHIPVPTTPTKLSRHSKIPPPTAKPIVLKRENEEAEVTRPDEEFDKIYEEIVENTQSEIEVEHPEVIESKFEEIIHDYDENKVQPINVEKIRQSRIPSLQRRTSEQAESKTVVVTERQKSRSLPRLKEISMRVKADNEVLGQTKYTRSVSTEKKEGGQRRIIETKIIKNPETETKISKVVTTETVTSGKELSKTIDRNSKSVTVQRTVRVTSQGDVLDDINKNIDQTNILHTENIMKGSITIAYPTFEAEIINNTNEIRKETNICENTKNEGKYITYGENETVGEHNKSNVLEGTSIVESNKQINIGTKVSVNQLASNYDTVAGAKDIASSKILAEKNANSVEITEINPTIKRTMTISRVTSSSNDNDKLTDIESSKTPGTEKENITSITEHKSIEIRNKIPTIECHSTVTRVVSSSNDVNSREIQEFKSSGLSNLSSVETITTEQKLVDIENTQAITKTEDQTVKQIEYTRTPIRETNGSFKNVTTECTIVDQKTSPTVEHSTSITRLIESNNVKTKDIEYNKSVKDKMNNNIEKDIPRKTLITEISNQMNETQDNAEYTDISKKETGIQSYKVENKKNAEELTTVTRKVEKLTYKTNSGEVTTESTRKVQVDELPKKKSILSKIAMFEGHNVEDRMPKKKSENLSKLVIKHSPQKVAHLHTPTIVEEVLKSQENSPLTISSNKDFSCLKSESVKSSSYILSPGIKQDGEYSQNVNLIDKDHRFIKSESIVEFDYKVKADEHKQTAELSKVNSNFANQDLKDHIATSDYKLQEVKNVATEPEQNVETKKETTTLITRSSYNGNRITSELVSSIKHKVEADIENRGTLNDKEIKINEENSIIALNNKGDNAVTPKPPRTYDYQFKGVNRLASEYERRTEISKDTNFITRDVKIDSFLRPDPVTTIDNKFDNDIIKHTYEIDKKFDTSQQVVEITDKSKDQLSLTPEPTMTLDKSFKIDIKKQSIDYDRITDTTENKSFNAEDKEENPVTSEAPTIEYTFKDVKKIATEYEQKAKFTKNLEVPPLKEPLSPTFLNYDSKYISKSNESLGKIMTDAPVILITPKSDFQTNTSINKEDDQVKILKIQAKDTVTPQAAERNQTELVKQISTEYKDLNTNNTILDTPSINSTVLERSTSLKTVETKNLNSSTTINESNSTLTQSSTKISAVNWVSKPTIDTKTTSNTLTIDTKFVELTKGDCSEVNTTKLKGYVIKREGDLAYARIQEEAEFGDEIRTFNKVSKLPRTPVKETTSTVTRRFKSVEEKKKYYSDVDINTVIKGKVSRMISRMTSVERQEADKKTIDIKEMPRKMSVLEKIAMFESKAAAGKTEYSYVGRTKVEKSKPQIHNMTQEEFEDRVTELKSARLLYGKIENMPNILLRNGVEMPVLALGTATLDTRLIPYIIGAAIDLGYRAIDTAYVYGNEKEIGDAIRAKIEDGTVRRDDLFIISKLWNTFHRTDLVEKACRSSLEAMGLEYFDLYLIHNPMSFKEGKDTIPKVANVIQYSQYDYLDAWYGMEQLMTKGLVRSIGVSNFNSVQLQTILDKGKIKPTVNQVECHPYLSQQKLDSFCEERDIKLSCFGVLGSKGTPAEYKSTLPPVIDDPLVQVMASGLNVSPAQLLIRYQLDSGRAAVVKTSSGKRLWDNLQALTFTLTQGQVEALQALNRNKRTFTFKGLGDTHKNYPFKISF